MDSLQNQVASLNTRVDALQRSIDQLNDKTVEVLSEVRANTSVSEYGSASVSRRYGNTGFGVDATLTHKDVLVDSDYQDAELQSGDRGLSPEIQIQRLTAQLTAAYNRIAALEEQLLAQRIQ
ncbi:hypothetical protein H6F67_25070 [Microcoleus sp. FACHB-1515]|uniref:hypothetical protein n=1 Tax=Cyanophyceae TaxID=3028117 RepID=UPI0016864F3B|nr:hypothetical protein [Microcoleus sp. FACHB-1515]MBD2093120.1 hypothetical protein [Microcoleus sp. FACHB-1515]